MKNLDQLKIISTYFWIMLIYWKEFNIFAAHRKGKRTIFKYNRVKRGEKWADLKLLNSFESERLVKPDLNEISIQTKADWMTMVFYLL